MLRPVMTNSAPLTREVISDPAAFAALRDEWNRLLARADWPNPYVLHEWLQAWWEGFRGDRKLHVVLVREGGELVAAAPWMIDKRTRSGLPVRALCPLGLNIGFPDVIVAGPPRECLQRLVLDTLRETRCTIALLRGVREDQRAALRSLLDDSGGHYQDNDLPEIFLDVTGGAEGYKSGRKTKFWANVRNRTKRIGKEGAVTFERHRDARAADAVMEAICAISNKSWKGDAGTATGQQDTFERGFRRLLELQGERGEAEFCVLRVDGRPIAYRIGYLSNGYYYEADIAFDPEWKRFSPGTLLGHWHNEQLVEEGVKEIVLGQDFPWKNEWSPSRRTLRDFIVYRSASPYAWLVGKVDAFREKRANKRDQQK